MLQLKRPIVFFDLECTGLDKENDRIVQIALYKLMPDFTAGSMWSYLINPQMPIPAKSTEIHGITDEMVKDKPLFRDIAGEVFDYFVGCDVGGYNSNAFDVPFLFNEFMRAGFQWNASSFNMIDVGNLFKIKETRTLSAAVLFYCHREMQNAHDAAVDITETVNVFLAQLMHYADLPGTVEELALYTNYGQKLADLSGKFYYDADNQLRYNFGKWKGELVSEHLDFAQWMYYKATFPTDTNEILAEVLNVFTSESDEWD
ncbi:3'-5' exonuclease [Spirosoma sp. HMF4905]|uniref:3'-5' exonuclease n=1 Tax=Spirosoma arboris TaxID=2682092 RepID=A0A7K1SKT1_9BACT|nr:3'-5' exonuclease [Spirosoma arboris]MVM34421.1 3'-5' exonuclease [Spirosoma arboris]